MRVMIMMLLVACSSSMSPYAPLIPPDGPPQFSCEASATNICNAAIIIGWQTCERATRCAPPGQDVQACAVDYVTSVCQVFDCSKDEPNFDAVVACADQLGDASCGQQVTCTP